MRPRIGLTVGDPAGIGPEISEYAAHDPHVTAVCEPVLYGPALAEAEPVFPVGVATAESGRGGVRGSVSGHDGRARRPARRDCDSAHQQDRVGACGSARGEVTPTCWPT